MYDIVVAKYTENIQWVRDFYEKNRELIRTIFIYDKSPPNQFHFDGLPIKYEERANIGREGETFVHHIFSKWDEHADCTVFLQGKPFDHLGTESLTELPKQVDHVIGFQDTKIYTERFTENHVECPFSLPVHHKIRQYFDVSNASSFQVSFIPGAQYIVPRNIIHSRPKWFYELLLHQLHELKSKDQVTFHNLYHNDYNKPNDVLDAWTLERLWLYIFDAVTYPTRMVR